MSTSTTFRHQAMVEAIEGAIRRCEKVMVVACTQAPFTTCQRLRASLPEVPMLYVTDFELLITPTNKPFLAFNRAEVVVVTPSYLHRHLTTPSSLFCHSVLFTIGLLIVDGLDACADATTQATVELGIQRLCVQALDLTPRRVMVAIRPTSNPGTLLTWLHAQLRIDPTVHRVNTPFTSAWKSHLLVERHVTLLLLAAEGPLTENAVDAWVARTVTTDPGMRQVALHNLCRERTISVENVPDGPPIYQLTARGKAMTCCQLSFIDVRHLQYHLRLSRLTWWDLLLLTATTPNFPVASAIRQASQSSIAQRLSGLPSQLFAWPHSALRRRLNVSQDRLAAAVTITVIGYLTTQQWTPPAIADALGLDTPAVEAVISAIRQRVAAAIILTEPHPPHVHGPYMRGQSLWHMLTGIAPQYLGLTMLPDVKHWVLQQLIHAQITTLTGLIQCDPLRADCGLNRGLLRHLQAQARQLLANYANEEDFIADFTRGCPLINATLLRRHLTTQPG